MVGLDVEVGVGVILGAEVGVGVRVCVGVGVIVGVEVGVWVGVLVGVWVDVGVGVGAGQFFMMRSKRSLKTRRSPKLAVAAPLVGTKTATLLGVVLTKPSGSVSTTVWLPALTPLKL